MRIEKWKGCLLRFDLVSGVTVEGTIQSMDDTGIVLRNAIRYTSEDSKDPNDPLYCTCGECFEYYMIMTRQIEGIAPLEVEQEDVEDN